MAVKASERVKRYQNPNGPTISTVERKVIEQDGLYFKDIDGTGTVSAVNDWRLTPAERAEAYVKVLTTSEKIGQIFTSDWRMGPKYPSPRLAANGHKPVADESGLLDEAPVNVSDSIFGSQSLPSTSDMVKKSFNRHVILRESPTPEDLADYLNQLQYLTETCDHFVPMQVMSNSRNENGEVVFGMNDATGVFATYPGTLGIAAAVKGTARIDIIDKFADTIRREWNACGLKKGYMYMADCVTDPRWQRTFGTFGEDPALIEEIFDHLIPGIQGGSNGVTPEGVSMTVKHFPGGGARENGFDPHYAAGQWNIYATPGSLQKYHIPAFRAAIRHNAESIMPYYSKPSAEKSAPQEDFNGNAIELQPYGFAYNKVFIDGLLRGQMGFKGYINSDTGIVHNMCWGVDMLDEPERIGYAVTQSGVDLISGLLDNELGEESYARGTNDYYDTHAVPAGFKKEDLVLTDASLNRAVSRTLTELFRQGMFEDTYADPRKAAEVVATKADWEEASRVHRESVVLLKNDGTLPLKDGTKVYAEAFGKSAEAGEAATKALREMLGKKTRLQRNHQHQKPICDRPVVICRQQMQHIEILVAQAEQRADNREENILDLALKDRKQQKIHAEQAQRTAKYQGIQIPASAHAVDVLRSGQVHLRQTAAFAVHEICILTDHLDLAVLAGVNRYEHVVDARLRLRRRRPHLADFEHFTAVYQHARAVIE